MQDKISALRLAVAGAFSLTLLFTLCWLGALILPAGPTHLFISLFTAAPVASLAALLAGSCASFFTGAIAGMLLAVTHNLTSGLTAKSE